MRGKEAHRRRLDRPVNIELTTEWVALSSFEAEVARLIAVYQPAMTKADRGPIWLTDLPPEKQRKNPRLIRGSMLKLFFLRVKE